MSVEELLNCRMDKVTALCFDSWTVKYVIWNSLHDNHNLRWWLWCCIYVIWCISRHSVFTGLSSVGYFQHLSVYSQALLSIFFTVCSNITCVTIILKLAARIQYESVSPSHPLVVHVTEIPAHKNFQLQVSWTLTCLCIFFINL